MKGAERDFETVTKLEPTYANGWVNIARARVLEGNTDAAKPVLEKALALDPDLASAHYFRGLALKADGQYPEALEDFAKAAARYPRDRVVRNQMGRMLFLQRKYREAVAELDKTLAVDPEDLEAHYNLMLCYRGLNDDALGGPRRKNSICASKPMNPRAHLSPGLSSSLIPMSNNEAQPVHEHVVSGAREGRGR